MTYQLRYTYQGPPIHDLTKPAIPGQRYSFMMASTEAINVFKRWSAAGFEIPVSDVALDVWIYDRETETGHWQQLMPSPEAKP